MYTAKHQEIPLVSIIVPCHNYGAYIAETIESIRAQTYPHWEIIIIDDGSTDNTAEVVAKYTIMDQRIRYQHQKKQGVSVARNTGLALAKGEYIQFLDADDYIAAEKLAIQVALLEADPSIALVYADTYGFIHQVDTTLPRVFKKFTLSQPPVSGQGPTLALHMAHDNIFLIGSPLFRRSMAAAAGPFDHTLVSMEDWDFWYRAVLQDNKFVYDNRPGTEFYVRTHGYNTTANRHRMWKSKIQARQKIIDTLRELMEQDERQVPSLKPVLAKHMSLLYEEKARFNLLYGKLLAGMSNTWRYFLQGEKPLRIWYDSAYWIKERLLGRNKISS